MKLARFALVSLVLGIAAMMLSAGNPPGGTLVTPLHGGTLGEADPQPASPISREEFKKLQDDVAYIKAGMKKILEDEDPTPEPEKTSEVTGKVLERALDSCLECHNPKVYKKDGDGFLMFGGEKGNVLREDFGKSELRRMRDKVKEGTMPKKSAKKKLTAEGRASLVAELEARLVEMEKDR